VSRFLRLPDECNVLLNYHLSGNRWRGNLTYTRKRCAKPTTPLSEAAMGALTSQLTTYNTNAVNELLSTTNPDRQFTYDADGNMTRGFTPDGRPFDAAYDAENRLSSVFYTDGSGLTRQSEFIYGGDGLLALVKSYASGMEVDETRVLRAGFLPLQERNESNQTTRQYAWGLNLGGGIGGLINLRQGGQNYGYLYDGKGNVSAVLDGSQIVKAAYRYDAFGNLKAKTGTIDQPFGFSTKRYFGDVGLSYFGYRFYSPGIGRWMNRDPIGEAGGINLYGFVQNDPGNLIDPLGLEILVCNRKAGGATGASGGNHAYLWDTTANNGKGEGYGMQGSSGFGNHTPESGPAIDACNEVEGSSGKEQQIMDYLKFIGDKGMWFPGINDCHNKAKRAVKSQGLQYPGAPGGRFWKHPTARWTTDTNGCESYCK
jgi:RHS repeat-associated protein